MLDATESLDEKTARPVLKAAITVFFGCAACVSTVGLKPPSAPEGGIVGKVIDSSTGAPLADAYLMLVSPKALTTATMTEKDGAFDFSTPPGVYDLMVRKAGFITAFTRGLRVESGDELVIDVKLRPGEAGPPPAGFAEVIEPPTFLFGPSPLFTDQALREGVSGLVIAKCLVTVQGEVRDCRVLRTAGSVLDAITVRTLEKRRYLPARLGGLPVEVNYTFRVNFTLP